MCMNIFLFIYKLNTIKYSDFSSAVSNSKFSNFTANLPDYFIISLKYFFHIYILTSYSDTELLKILS